MRTIMLAGMAILTAAAEPAAAQLNPTLSEAERGIRAGGAAQEAAHLRIETLEVAAHVTGPTADVTIDLRIASDSRTPFEATLALALPADAVVTGYALDIDGTLIDGQLIEQPKARNLYEAEVRRGVDPGLAEISTGNRFTTRIFPIDSRRPRLFRLRFSAPFNPAQGLVLPFARDLPIGRLRVRVTADGFTAAPEVRFAGAAVPLAQDGASWATTIDAANAPLREGLTIRGGTSRASLLVTEHASGGRFFTIADSGGTPPAQPNRGGRLRLYWDRSRSHRDDRTDLEIETLLRLVDMRAPVAIDLVRFASDRPNVVTLRTAAELRAALTATVYRGATSFAGLDALPLAAADACVMVSDGQVTVDQATSFAPDCRLVVLTASAGADGARLGRIAQRSNGMVVRVREGQVAEAAAQLARPGIGVTAIRDDAGRTVAFRALPAAAGGWLLVGPMPATGGLRVRLTGIGERRYAADGAVVRTDAPAALWAAPQVAELSDDPARHDAMVALARRYHVGGPAMSFLVLETPDQYLRAGLTPPPGFPAAWMQDYRAIRQRTDKQQGDAKDERLAFVLREWTERRTWWKTRFVALPRSKRPLNDDMDAAPPPPPPPAPAPMPSAMEAPPAIVQTPLVPAPLPSADLVVSAARATPPPAARPRGPSAAKPITLDLASVLADRPYLAALAAARPEARLTVLAEQERAYGSVPTFYLDVAEWFRLAGDAATAEQLLLSALELPTSDDETRQILVFRLERDRSYDRAVEMAERLAAANATFRPQPARDLALALAARGQDSGKAGRADLERAFALLTQTALNPASTAFNGIETVALMEANALIPRIEAAGGRWSLDPRLVGRLDTDARIVMEWTADDADIDLWVDEPNGERVYYSKSLSSAGGQISNDMTDGYGPEEYAIRRAPPGAYQIRINGYDADRINPNGPGHVLIRLIRNFARPGEQQVMIDADLAFQQGRNRDTPGEAKPVATLRVGR